MPAFSGHQVFIAELRSWYEANKRSLPWRSKADPFKVWLSEIILQQTRVEQGLPYYESFIKSFPDVKSLASAPPDKVMRLWQGLGYYSRARNLHLCAREISVRLGGKFPRTSSDLRELPGIGPYTAAAIASICFEEPVPVVDGNVYRVLSRVFGIHDPIDTPAGKRVFNTLAETLMSIAAASPGATPGDYNQAVMEFGALQCVPKSPDCKNCPLQSMCHARARGTQTVLPVKSRSKKKKTRHFHYLVVTDGKKILLRQRTGKDIWNQLYDFPMLEGKTVNLKRPLRALLKQGSADLSLKYRLIRHQKVAVSRHILTHQEIQAHFHLFLTTSLEKSITDDNKSCRKKDSNSRLVTFIQAEKLPKPIIIARFLETLMALLKKNSNRLQERR